VPHVQFNVVPATPAKVSILDVEHCDAKQRKGPPNVTCTTCPHLQSHVMLFAAAHPARSVFSLSLTCCIDLPQRTNGSPSSALVFRILFLRLILWSPTEIGKWTFRARAETGVAINDCFFGSPRSVVCAFINLTSSPSSCKQKEVLGDCNGSWMYVQNEQEECFLINVQRHPRIHTKAYGSEGNNLLTFALHCPVYAGPFVSANEPDTPMQGRSRGHDLSCLSAYVCHRLP
jgi:hypothetical protein